MMYKVILKYDKKGRAARISGGRPAFNIQQDHTLPVMVFLFFSQLLRVGIDIHPAPVFLGMQPFPLSEHDKGDTRRDDRNQHDQSDHEPCETVGDDKADDGSAGNACRPVDIASLDAHELQRPLKTFEQRVVRVTFVLALHRAEGLCADTEEHRKCLCGSD